MARDIRPTYERSRAKFLLDTIAPPATALYWQLVEGDWVVSETGPADGYTAVEDGDSYPSDLISAHEGFLRKVGTDYLVKP